VVSTICVELTAVGPRVTLLVLFVPLSIEAMNELSWDTSGIELAVGPAVTVVVTVSF